MRGDSVPSEGPWHRSLLNLTLSYAGSRVRAQGEVGKEGSWGLPLRRQLISCHCVPHRVPLSTFHFLFLIFLKLALFLSMLGAVLCVSRRQRGPGGNPSQLDQENPPCKAQAQAPGTSCPGAQTYRLDKRDLQALQCRAGKRSAWVCEGLKPSGGIVPVPQRKVPDVRERAF